METTIKSGAVPRVFFSADGYEKLQEILSKNHFSKIFVLVDSNTHEHCLPSFLGKLESSVGIEVVEMEPGDENKNIDTCNGIWKALSELGADRKSLLINLGGGVVTDLGGFVACCFKRGIRFINIPTTLLAMVDAALGGKTGVNLDGLKNQIGIIQPAELVLIDTSFLRSLSSAEMRSGLAEMLKHGLIQDEVYWKKLSALGNFDVGDLDDLILESVVIKEAVVARDPREENLRKSLNFGHTLGHAIESYFLDHPEKKHLLHGEAVAAGMILATYISSEMLSFPREKFLEISNVLFSLFGRIDLSPEDQNKIIELLKFDKKNESGKINFVLLKDIGEPVIDVEVPNEILEGAFRYYLKEE